MATRRAPYFDKANELWIGEIHLGFDANGKRLRRRVSSRSYDLCVKKLEKLEAEVERGDVLLHAPERTTMQAWLERWLETKIPTVGPNTAEDYRSKVQRHLIPRLGKVLLQKLTPLHLATLFRDLDRDGVGKRTQQIVHVVLNQALEEAVTLELMAKNPLERVKRPKLDRRARAAKPTWTVETVKAFLEEASRHELAALFVVAVTTGMRQSEVFGLLWENVHLDRGYLRVEWSLHEVNKGRQTKVDPRCGPGLTLEPPKTETSRRTIALSQIAVDALRKHREETRSKLFVFTTSEGAPIRSRWFRDVWDALLEQSKAPPLPFKQLRHTCLTLLAEGGVSQRAAQSLAGHSTQALTADVYQQATAKLARQAADAMDRMLGPGDAVLEAEPD
jgi:integrase